jgi:hypothetical protein
MSNSGRIGQKASEGIPVKFFARGVWDALCPETRLELWGLSLQHFQASELFEGTRIIHDAVAFLGCTEGEAEKHVSTLLSNAHLFPPERLHPPDQNTYLEF